MKYLTSWCGVIYSATSSCFDLVRRCCWVTLFAWPMIQLPVWPLLGLFICSQLQTPAPENTTCGKKMIGRKIDLFLKLRIFWGFWIDYARSLRTEAMIFSVWYWPLLGQHLVAVIFFSSVDFCGSVFCAF